MVLVFSKSNLFINKNFQGRKLSAKKKPSSGNSALVQKTGSSKDHYKPRTSLMVQAVFLFRIFWELVWWEYEKKPFQFWLEIWIWVLVILLQLLFCNSTTHMILMFIIQAQRHCKWQWDKHCWFLSPLFVSGYPTMWAIIQFRQCLATNWSLMAIIIQWRFWP